MTEPERLFRSWIQLTKPERLVGIERQCTKSANDGWPAFMKAFVIAYDELHRHYGGKRNMKRSWDTAKAKQGEMDRVLEGLVRMVGETMGNKLPDKKKVIVAIGLGEFETKNSRHIGFTRYLIRKLKPLGYTIVGVDEYYTSQKCPCCGGDVLAAENMVNILTTSRVSFAPEKTHGPEESRDSIGGLKTRDKFTECLCERPPFCYKKIVSTYERKQR
ncbi:hypothetical protein SeLEV6574_g05976 [Synchytrium endobioticum]|nr:hypothetical protein SeLEV6574_g05976 [Synchytrium endobioticum]